tara:strand:- start:1327 stop:2622 length:1296 start_codon:yes stop_codon:yes gene_type:complete
MAEIEPFRGWRYGLDQVGALADVVAPPYDVIDSEFQDRLYQQHPCNIVRLILNRDEPGDESETARYHRAAGFLERWQSDGILVRDEKPSLYVYHQEFTWEGVSHIRRGFLGRIRLERFGTGTVFPHEQTMPGPKADRLALWEHGRTCLSPVFGLYSADTANVQGPLEVACEGREADEVVDDDGVVHRLWAVSDAEAISAACDHLAEAPVFIADGHHRYETALNYQEAHPDVDAAGYTMMMLVGMNDPGLAILPTHRLVSGLDGLDKDRLTGLLAEHFEVTSMGTGREASRAAWARIDASGDQDSLALGTSVDGEWLLATLRDGSVMERLAEDRSAEWRGLGVSRLHTLLIDGILGPAYEDRDLGCRYVHLMDEVDEAIESGGSPLAVLVAPATLEHVRQIASRLETMPPKSTFFYPKLLSGLALYPLSDEP